MFLFSVVISRGGLGSERRKEIFPLMNTSKVRHFYAPYADSFWARHATCHAVFKGARLRDPHR